MSSKQRLRLLWRYPLIRAYPDGSEYPICGRGVVVQRLQGSAPPQIIGQVFRGNAVEAAHPLLEAAVIRIDVANVEIRRARVRFAGCRQDVVGIPALRAKATIALPPSQQNSLAGVTIPPSAAAMETRFSFGSTASVVAPWRSRAMPTDNATRAKPVDTAPDPRRP
jgi:hypothetical protein